MKKIVIVSTMHDKSAIANTLEGLKKTGIKKGTLVLIEGPENSLKMSDDPRIGGYTAWKERVKKFVLSKGAYIGSLEPQEIWEKRGKYQSGFFVEKPAHTKNAASLATEDIMMQVIKEKLKKYNKIVVVTGLMHGPRLSRMLKKEFNVKHIPAFDRSEDRTTDRSIRANLLGQGKRVFFSKDDIRPLTYEERQGAKNVMNDIKSTKWTMPSTYRKDPRGWLVKLRTRKH